MTEIGWFYPLAVLAVLLVGISKSGFGGGLGVMAVPMMSLAIAPQKAAAILLPLLVVMDFFTVYHYRKNWDKRNLLVLLPSAVLGILLGSQVFRYLSDAIIRLMVGTLAVLFAAHFFTHFRLAETQKASIPKGAFWGAIAGFTSFGVHAGGPPINIYLLPQKMPKSLFVGTTVIFFTLVNLIKIIPYALLGQLNPENLVVSLILAPLAPLGVWLGLVLHHRVNENLFYKLCYLFLGVTGIKLLWDGFTGL